MKQIVYYQLFRCSSQYAGLTEHEYDAMHTKRFHSWVKWYMQTNKISTHQLSIVPLFIPIHWMDQTWLKCNAHQQIPLMSQITNAIKAKSPMNLYWKLSSVTKHTYNQLKHQLWCHCINSTYWFILHPQGPNLGAIHSLNRHPNTPNTPRSCPQDKTIKTSTHLQSAGGVSAVELTPRRRYLYTTSTMYCTRRCNCYLYTTSDQATCQPI